MVTRRAFGAAVWSGRAARTHGSFPSPHLLQRCGNPPRASLCADARDIRFKAQIRNGGPNGPAGAAERWGSKLARGAPMAEPIPSGKGDRLPGDVGFRAASPQIPPEAGPRRRPRMRPWRESRDPRPTNMSRRLYALYKKAGRRAAANFWAPARFYALQKSPDAETAPRATYNARRAYYT